MPGLYFVGMHVVLWGVLYEIGLEAREVAQEVGAVLSDSRTLRAS